ncbi:Superoxide dismutase [Mn], mitochondrial [Entophlyctis luteolus]|nr:Superoxide dismutase [Mn], mitochondrial [Entophlyctis luteolus]
MFAQVGIRVSTAAAASPAAFARTGAVRSFAAAAATGGVSKFLLPDLPYSPSAVSNVSPATRLSRVAPEIMELHHGKHHNAYVTNLNVAIEKLEDAVAKKDTAAVVQLHSAINFNYGGALQTALVKQFASLEDFQKQFNAAAAGVQGSGWGWLVYNKTTKALEIATTSNQDPIVGHRVPLLGIDVWEHAYYLQYRNVRPDYLKAVWSVVNWKDVSERYLAASQ